MPVRTPFFRSDESLFCFLAHNGIFTPIFSVRPAKTSKSYFYYCHVVKTLFTTSRPAMKSQEHLKTLILTAMASGHKAPYSEDFNNDTKAELIHQLIPIVSLARFVTEVRNQALHVGSAHAKCRSSLRDNIFFNHDAA